MRTTIALLIGTILLSGCQARADDHSQDEAIFHMVDTVMCAPDTASRQEAVSRLADAIENYSGGHEGDSASAAVNAALDDFTPATCDTAAQPA